MNLLDEYLKSTVRNMLKKLKESIRTMCHQTETINEEIKNIRIVEKF